MARHRGGARPSGPLRRAPAWERPDRVPSAVRRALVARRDASPSETRMADTTGRRQHPSRADARYDGPTPPPLQTRTPHRIPSAVRRARRRPERDPHRRCDGPPAGPVPARCGSRELRVERPRRSGGPGAGPDETHAVGRADHRPLLPVSGVPGHPGDPAAPARVWPAIAGAADRCQCPCGQEPRDPRQGGWTAGLRQSGAPSAGVARTLLASGTDPSQPWRPRAGPEVTLAIEGVVVAWR